MNAYRIETTLTENGTLTLQGLPFSAGDAVEIIVLELGSQKESVKGSYTSYPNANPYPLRGKVIRYDDPTEPVALEDWEVLQ
jgi:hypothetical protein